MPQQNHGQAILRNQIFTSPNHFVIYSYPTLILTVLFFCLYFSGEGLLTPGSVITTADGKDAGRARGHLGQYGLGLMRVNIRLVLSL